jgi:hypothetical protein
MRRFVACLLLCLAVVPAAQAALTLPMPWKQGLQLRYRSTSATEKVRGQLHTRVQIQDITELAIVEANPNGFVQTWRSRKPEVATTGDGDQVMDERRMVQAMLKRFENLPLEARLDAQGAYLGLRNWEALGEAMREVMLPVMLAKANARKDMKGVDQAQLRARMEQTLANMTTQRAVDGALGRQVALYNFFIAPSLERGKVRRYQESIASPWSDDTIPSQGVFEITAVDEVAGTVTIRWQQGIDPTRGAEWAWKAVEALTGAKPGSARDAKQLPKGLQFSDEATVVIARATGIPQRIEHRRRVALGDSSTDQRWTLERLRDATR